MFTKEEILDYVMNTPGNTNRAILKSLLDGIENEYPKPATTRSVPVTINNNTHETGIISLTSPLRGYFVTKDGLEAIFVDNAVVVYPYYNEREDNYMIECKITSSTDTLNVTLNGNTIPFNTNGYFISLVTNEYPTEYNIVISEK